MLIIMSPEDLDDTRPKSEIDCSAICELGNVTSTKQCWPAVSFDGTEGHFWIEHRATIPQLFSQAE
jgi:hypothetical protein